MCFADGRRNDRTSTIPIVFCLFGSVAGFPPSLARLRLSGRRRSFAGTVPAFERVLAPAVARWQLLRSLWEQSFFCFNAIADGSWIEIVRPTPGLSRLSRLRASGQ